MSQLRRALTGATTMAVLAAGLLVAGAAPASAFTSDQCAHDTSTRLLTGNHGDFKLWLESVEDAEGGYRDTHICFGASTVVRGDLVYRTPITVTPDVEIVPTTADCPELISLQDPIDLVTRLGRGEGYPLTICFGVGEEAFQVTVTAPVEQALLDVTLYLDKGTLVVDRFCSVYVGYPQCYLPSDSLRFELV